MCLEFIDTALKLIIVLSVKPVISVNTRADGM